MRPIKAFSYTPADPIRDLERFYTAENLALLNRLRFHAIECRAEKRVEFFEACALIQADPASAVDEHIAALIRILDQAIGHKPTIHAPGCKTLSFDEKWLLQIFQQSCVEDLDSVLFLIRRRVISYKQRAFGALVMGLLQSSQETSRS